MRISEKKGHQLNKLMVVAIRGELCRGGASHEEVPAQHSEHPIS